MSGTTAPVSPSSSGTVTWHVGRTEKVPLTFTKDGVVVSEVPGGTLATADATIATATMSADGNDAMFYGSAVGTTTASLTDSSGGLTFSAAPITLIVVPDPAADGVTFDVAGATEQPAASSSGTATPPAS